MAVTMTTYFKQNKTPQCTCGEQKPTKAIFCEWCANHWDSLVHKEGLIFKNSNSSVEWMNAMHNDFFGDMAETLDNFAELAPCPCS
jgi:hypothetical protein